MSKISSSYEVVIRPQQPWLHFDWRGIVQYRDLFWEMVRRDFSARYKQTILGPAWFVINPLVNALIMFLVFAKGLGVKTDDVHPFLFYLGGQLGWAYFSQVLGGTGNTLGGNIHLFGKVYFPRLIVPLSVVASNLISLLIQLITFSAAYVFLAATDPGVASRPTLFVLLLPLVVLHTAMLALGVGLILSSVSAKYKDFGHLTGYLMQLWMFVTPLIYPLSKIPARWQWLAVLNPMTCITEAFRAVLLGTPGVSVEQYAVSIAITLALFAVGVLMFQRTARTFIDYA
jgi:lipopolysaccharide transport system permease protein